MTPRSHAKPRLYLQVALVAVSLGLGGCASKNDRYSVFPSNGRACSIEPGGELIKLEPGQSCFAQVIARQRISLTPLRVDPCERYEVTVPPAQVWDDKGRVSRPPHGEAGSVLMNLFKRYKRVKDAQWFALIGTAVDIQKKEPSVSHFDQDLGVCPVLAITREGQLGFYPNDAVAPWGDGSAFYANNNGEIWVQVTRNADACKRSTGELAQSAPACAEK